MWGGGVLLALVAAGSAAAGPVRTPKIAASAQALAARGARVQVYVRVEATGADTLAALRDAGLAIELVDEGLVLVQGRIDPDRLGGLAALPAVHSVRRADRARPRVGAVTSEGDTAARADRLRADGPDGTGVRVGVISLGADGIAASQATGDLPAVTVPLDPRCQPGSGDEGTAMLELVHDLAPGAQLFFSGAATSLEFIAAVRCLVAADVDVLVDDLGFFGEPYFRDGPVALAVREAVNAGVVYVTAAGNDAGRHVEQAYRQALCGNLHAFGPGTTDCTNHVLLAPGEFLDCTLQWNDPFAEAANDYDLLLVDESGTVLAESDDPQQGMEDPIESIAWVNDEPAIRLLGLQVKKVAGEPRVLEMFCYGGQLQYVTPAGSIFGHAAVPEVMSVGAIDVHDPGLDDVEAFSSQGPAQLYFPVATRAKPDIAAFDGVTTTVLGFAPFVGTSAAAPHVAAGAALLLAKNGFLSPSEVLETLRAGAVDVGPPGVDATAGAGRLDVFAAARRVLAPECHVDSDCGNACPIDGCHDGACIHSLVRGAASFACERQVVPPGIAARFERACRLVVRRAAALTPRRFARLGRKADRALARAMRGAERAGRTDVSPACAASVLAGLAAAEARANSGFPPPPVIAGRADAAGRWTETRAED